MFGNLSLDMFVLRKKKSTYFTALVMFGCVVLASLVSKYASNNTEAPVDTSFMGIFTQSTSLAVLFLSVFFVMFLGSDLKNGFIKNTAGAVRNRMGYIFSKEITLAVYSIAGFAALMLGSFVCTTVLFDGTKSFEMMPFIKYIGIMYLLLIGLASFISFLVFSLRNTTAPMIITLLLTSGTVMNLIYNPIEILLDKAGVNFEFRYISVTSNLLCLNGNSSSKDMLIACAVAAGSIVVFNVLTKIVMDKKDIA